MLLVHGIQDSADAWLMNDKDSPAFMLSEAGYDVWLANLRGNKYSKKHLSLDIMKPEYWDFGWEESALYDLPAFTDFILSKTGYKKLAFIGHSLGTTAALFALTENIAYY